MRLSFKYGIILLIVILPLYFLPVVGFSWGNGGFTEDPEKVKYGTMDWIFYKAFKMVYEKYPERVYWIEGYLDFFLLASEAPDNPNLIIESYHGFNTSNLQVNYYMYIESNNSVININDSCSQLAEEAYINAIEKLKERKIKDAVWYAAIALHYVAEMGCWTNVIEDPYNDEAYETQLDSLFVTPYVNAFEIPEFNISKITAYDAALRLGNFSYFYDGVYTAQWMNATFYGNSWESYNEWNDDFKNATIGRLIKTVEYVADVIYTISIEANYTKESEISFQFIIFLILGPFVYVVIVIIAIALIKYHRKKKKGESAIATSSQTP